MSRPRGRADGRSHDSRGIYRTRAETAALRNSILDAWHAGEDGGETVIRLGINRAYLDAIVRRARAAGDPRSERRYRETDSYGWQRVVYGPWGDRVWSMYEQGDQPIEIARKLNVDEIRVLCEISRQQKKKTGHRRTRAEFVATVFLPVTMARNAKAHARAKAISEARRNGVTPKDLAATYGLSLCRIYQICAEDRHCRMQSVA